MRIPTSTASVARVGTGSSGCPVRRRADVHLASICVLFSSRHYPPAPIFGDAPDASAKAQHLSRTRNTVRQFVRVVRAELEVAS